MTESREDTRKRAWRDRARLDGATEPAVTDLTGLCIIVGCVRPRVGLNLCRKCQQDTNP